MNITILVITGILTHSLRTVICLNTRYTSNNYSEGFAEGALSLASYANEALDEDHKTDVKNNEGKVENLSADNADVLKESIHTQVSISPQLSVPSGDGDRASKQDSDSVKSSSENSNTSNPDGKSDQCNLSDIYSYESYPEIKGLEYLGNGYDVTKAKPFGDLETFVDTGYTQPVIRFSWNCRPEGKRIELPAGVWIRREPACHRGHSTNEITNAESLASVLSKDVSTTISAGIAQANYSFQKNDVHDLINSRNSKKFALKSQCAVFTTGMLLSEEWELTYAFRSALKPLASFQDKEKCLSTKDYDGVGQCALYYNLWKQFFNSYGTHVISRLTMGGKVLQIGDENYIKKIDESSKKKETNTVLDVIIASADLARRAAHDKAHKSKKDTSDNKCFIMGGNAYIDVSTVEGWKKWIESVEQNSMPIKLQLAPISYFIPIELRSHFWNAFQLYIKNNTVK